MTLSRRNAIKLGLGAGAGAVPLLGYAPLLVEAEARAPRARSGEVVKARPLPLSAVRLLAGPLKHAQELDASYLLALEPDRMLAYYRDRAGPRPTAEPHGRWAGDRRNRTALDVEIKFAAWAERVLSRLDDAQLQHMMNTEFGGMNEVMCDLYADTGDARWLALSYKFEHRAFLEPLERHQDDLAGTHANTQIPKILGSATRFLYTDSPADLLAAGFFWDRVVQHHSFSSGGHGKDEYFGPADELSDWIDGRTAETCNVYNMLKLTRRLFSFWPDPHYADYHERALFNHMLASIDPEDGRVCYMVPVGPG